jgi:hypothetical protein
MPDFDTRGPQEPDEPNGLRSRSLTDRVRNSLIANRLRTLLIGGGVLLFAVVAVSALAVSYYGSVSRSPSPSVEAKEPDRTSFKPLLERAELPDIRFHDLRHTCATLLSRGHHPRLVQELLGHSSLALTLDRYSHVMPGMEEQTAAAMEAARS